MLQGDQRRGLPDWRRNQAGLPSQPFPFALTVDILLRRLQTALPNAVIRAFADDIAIVAQDVDEALPIMQTIFEELEFIAGLSLNKRKCILIPLWPTVKEVVSQELVASFPAWADLQISFSGTYLGVNICPEAHVGFWDKAQAKYLERASIWGKLGLGLQLATLAYRVYILPVLSFLAQFREPTSQVLKLRKRP